MRRWLLLFMIVLLLTACASEPAYTPDAETLAAREAQEYQTRVDRAAWAWRVFMFFVIVGLTILTGLAYFLGKTVYRIHAARARIEEAKARAAWVISLGDGYALDLQTGSVISRYPASIPAETTPILSAPRQPEPLQPTNALAEFVKQVVQINDNDWESDVIPRWNHWEEIGMDMTPAEWMRKTDDLERLGLIDKRGGKRTVTVGEHNMATVYESVLHSPTLPGDRL